MPKNNVILPRLIVGIGASAGGLDSFKAFLSKLPKNSDMAYVLIPHLDPNHQSMMVHLLSGFIAIPVVEAKEQMLVEANHVYVLPPGKQLTIKSGYLHLNNIAEPRLKWTAIDDFLRSLAFDQGKRSVAIILSGTGCHGILGFREIKLAGGIIIAQDPSTATFDQMPNNAIETGLVDLITAPENMPAALIEYANHSYVKNNEELLNELTLNEIYRILDYLRTRVKYDFSGYRKNMLLRRIQRRMCVCHSKSLNEYYLYLINNPEEALALNNDLLIGVTAFFRDPEAFKTLEELVIPELIARSTEEKPTRIWVPACSSGEEVYTIAILLIEAFEHAEKPITLQIFASDIDEASLKIARGGEYAEDIVANMSATRLQQFFELTLNGKYRVNKLLRESIIFAEQNLISDTPFSRLDLISCRNVFIYLQPELQTNVLNVFHFALNRDGFLMLGPSESLGYNKKQFETISKKWRIFSPISLINKIHRRIPISTSFPAIKNMSQKYPIQKINYHLQPASRFAELVSRDLLDAYAPAAVLINRAFEILHFQGPTVNFLEFPKGTPSHDLIILLREGLRARVRTAVHYVFKENQPLIDHDARVKRQGHYQPCTITVRPVFDPKMPSELLLITFEEGQIRNSEQKVNIASIDEITEQESSILEQLEYELNATREDLQSSIEELESSNEDLKASNEEVMSMNEELQSANEELETSKEELQSMNEELNTVNSELQYKVEELEQSYDDTKNLLASTDIATLFLNRKFHVMLFNPAIGTLLNLRESDVGRAITDFSAKVINSNLIADAHLVLEKLSPVERDVWTTEKQEHDKCYLRRIVPYRTVDDHITGVVITFVDITERFRQKQLLEKRVQERTQELHAREARLLSIMENASEAIIAIDFNGFITEFNHAAEYMFDFTADDILGKNIEFIIPVGQLIKHSAKMSAATLVEKMMMLSHYKELVGLRQNKSQFPLRLTLTKVANEYLYIGIITDLSEQKVLKKAIVDISTLEQERIGQEIHDQLGQRLTGINLLISDFKRNLAIDDNKNIIAIDNIMDEISSAIGEARNISHALSPILFPPQKLREALDSLIKMLEKSDVHCKINMSNTLNIEDKAIALQIYRIVQEALNNVLKHAKANNVSVVLKAEQDHNLLIIEDDGIGFLPAENVNHNGIGLQIMKYRAESINATIDINSELGRGTKITCSF